MRVFVTGATGFIGSAVVRELIGGGHSVVGLARSEKGSAELLGAGAEVHRGTLDDLGTLRNAAAAADGVIHTAFNHDFSKFAENAEQDRRAIEALGEALAGSERPLLVTSGLPMVTPGQLGTEKDSPMPTTPEYPRASERTAASLRDRGVRASVVRLPPSVHGLGERGFIPILIGIAREKGLSAYVGDGSNRWPAVHRLDAARVFRLALEHGAAALSYHAVAEEGVAFRSIAEVIARRLGLPLVSQSLDEAAKHFVWFSMFAALDAPVSSEQTGIILGWKAEQPGLLEDMDQPGYFPG